MARQDYTATAGQTVFTYTFQIFEDSEIDVYKNGVQLTLTTDYTVSNATLPTIGGTVTLNVPASAGDAIALVQDIPIVRLIDYQTNGDWQATEVNSDFDRIYTLLVQQFIGGGGSSSTLSDRLVKFSDAVNRSTNTNLIPAPVVGNVLAWDATGDLENIAIPSIDAGQQVVAANIPSLRAAASGSSIGAVTLGGVSLNDGLQRAYYFDSASTATDNGSTIIKPNDIDSLDPGRWLDLPVGDDQITNDQLAADSVAQAQMQEDSVGEDEVIDSSITNAKRADMVGGTISGKPKDATTGAPEDLDSNEVADIVYTDSEFGSPTLLFTETKSPYGRPLGVAALSSGTIAVSTDGGVGADHAIGYYEYDGTQFTLVGNELDLIANDPKLTGLSSNRIAVYINGAGGSLQTRDFDGDDWNLVGNIFGLGLTGVNDGNICVLSSNSIALLARDNTNTLTTIRKLEFDGTDWSLVGNALSVSDGGFSDDLVALSEDRIAVVRGNFDNLQAYEFDGTDWAAVGNALTIPSTASNPRIVSLAVDSVAVTLNETGTDDRIRYYKFDGTDWAESGPGYNIGSVSEVPICALNGLDLILLDGVASTDLDFYVYRSSECPKSLPRSRQVTG